MTREEAREELKAEWEELISGSGLTGHVKEELDKNPDFKYVYEANMMAIKALGQKCENCKYYSNQFGDRYCALLQINHLPDDFGCNKYESIEALMAEGSDKE